MHLVKATMLMIAALVLVAAPARAGWVQEDTDGTRLLIQDGKVKEVPQEAEEPWTVMDLVAGKVLMVNPEAKVYTTLDMNEFCQMMSRMAARLGQQAKPGGAFKIVNKGPGPKIAGLATVKYEATSGGRLREELWLTSDAPFAKEFDLKLLARFAGCGAGPNDVETQPEYQKLMASGWVLRSVIHEDGETSMDTDVKSLVQRKIPAEEFAPPAGYQQVAPGKVLSTE